MSYKLITKAVLTITNAAGEIMTREVQCRSYPAPKRDASGSITIDGADSSYKRTGGKGRGTVDSRYMYATVKGVQCFWAITEAEATAAVGGTVALVSVVAESAKTPEAKPAEAPVDTTRLVQAPAPSLTKAQRRAARQTA